MKTEKSWDFLFPFLDDGHWQFYERQVGAFMGVESPSWAEIVDHDLMMIGGGEL